MFNFTGRNGIDLDDPWWENEAAHSDLLNGTDWGGPNGWLTQDLAHDYLPLYAAYIDARTARGLITEDIAAINVQIMHLTWLKTSIDMNLGNGSESDVAAWESMITGEIEEIEGDNLIEEGNIVDALLELEKTRVKLDKGYVTMEEMVNDIAVCEAELANIQAEIALYETKIAALVVRLNAAMN